MVTFSLTVIRCSRGRAVKALDLKSNGGSPRRFESCRLRQSYFAYFRAYPIEDIAANAKHGAAIVHMILNNLDPKVAQFPQELVTYGGNGQVFGNWAQVYKFCL